MIRKEFELLKQDWMKPLNRFNMLDDYLAGGVEGIHAMKKVCILIATYQYHELYEGR